METILMFPIYSFLSFHWFTVSKNGKTANIMLSSTVLVRLLFINLSIVKSRFFLMFVFRYSKAGISLYLLKLCNQNNRLSSVSSWIKNQEFRHKEQIKVILPLYLSCRQTLLIFSVKLLCRISSATFLQVLKSDIYLRIVTSDEQLTGHWYSWNTSLVMNFTRSYPMSPGSINSQLV